jgi:hypothetical protein
MRTLKRPSHLIYTQRKFFDRITKFHSSKGTFVAPDPVEVPTDTIRNLAEFFCRHRNITVLSGAGCRFISLFLLYSLHWKVFIFKLCFAQY